MRDTDEIRRALEVATEEGVAGFVLGGGSNLLVADRGLDALVLRVRMSEGAMEPLGDAVLVRAGAGVGWDELVETTVARGLAGLECLSGSVAPVDQSSACERSTLRTRGGGVRIDRGVSVETSSGVGPLRRARAGIRIAPCAVRSSKETT